MLDVVFLRKSAKRFETQIPVDSNVYVFLDYFDRASTHSHAYNHNQSFLGQHSNFYCISNYRTSLSYVTKIGSMELFLKFVI